MMKLTKTNRNHHNQNILCKRSTAKGHKLYCQRAKQHFFFLYRKLNAISISSFSIFSVRRRCVCENLYNIKRNRRQHDVFLFLIVFPQNNNITVFEARIIKNNKTICDLVYLDSHDRKYDTHTIYIYTYISIHSYGYIKWMKCIGFWLVTRAQYRIPANT